ncbi:unnamed protein product [Callosobruchus maculatus]|uniref:Uncharacterized protein n=1 Tax=Callosobruchus maculatus TaxID=64391 RepID=A0A653BG43_CALMS|nr:unnamed protein product [Callosobruchus maculatus]
MVSVLFSDVQSMLAIASKGVKIIIVGGGGNQGVPEIPRHMIFS